MSSIEANVFKLYVGKSHVEPTGLGRINGIAPGGYGIGLEGNDVDLRHWGYGGEKNTEVMSAHGLLRGAHLAFMECESPTIYVITPNGGTERYLTEFVPKWLDDAAKQGPSFTKDGLEHWHQLYALSGLGRLIVRKPEGNEETQATEAAQALAKAVAIQASLEFTKDRERFAKAGVLVTDEDANAPKITLG
jgi:hypothetical protein